MQLLRKTIYPIFLLLAICSVIYSCDSSYLTRPIEPYNWKLDTTKVRLAYADITFQDILYQLNIDNSTIDPSDNILFSHTTTFNTENDNYIDLTLDEQNFTKEIETPISDATFTAIGGSPYIIPIGSPLATNIIQKDTFKNTIDITEKLSGALFETGNLTINIESSFDCDIDLFIKIPSISSKNDGLIYEASHTILNGQKTIEIDLRDYRANLSFDGENFDENLYNQFVIITESTFKFREGNNIQNTDKVTYKTQISNVQMNVIFGDFDTRPFDIEPKTISLNFFDEIKNYNIGLTNPKMTIKATNEFGFPIGVNITNTLARNSTTTETLTYAGITEDEKLIDNLLIFEGIESYNPPVTPKITNRTIDNSNSNLEDLIRIYPTELLINLTGEINPINKTPNKNFYSKEHDNLNVDVTIDIPIELSLDNVEIEENVPVDLSIIVNEINHAKFYVVTNNTLPLSGEIALRFYNNGINLNMNKANSVFESAVVSPETKTSIEPTENIAEFVFSGEEVKKLKQTTDIQILLTLNTPSAYESVKIESENSIDVVLISEFAGEFNFSTGL